MTEPEVDQLFAALATGATIRVPFSTTLYPDTRADVTKVRQLEDGTFEIVTAFNEFWAGHGWSLTQTEREVWSRAQLKSALLATEATACALEPRSS